MSWGKDAVSVSVVQPLVAASDTIAKTVDTALALLDALTLIWGLVERAQNSGPPTAATVRAALGALSTLLEGFLQEAGAAAYLLHLPLIPRAGSRRVQPLPMPSNLAPPKVQEILNQPARSGNAQIIQTIFRALYDGPDLNRPMMGADDYVAGVLIVTGGNSLAEALPSMVRLAALFGDVLPIPADRYALPVAQDVKVRTVRAAGSPTARHSAAFADIGASVDNPYAANVRWKDAPRTRIKPHLDNTVYTLKTWHLFLKEGSKIETYEDLKRYERLVVPVGSAYLPGEAFLYNLDQAKTYYVSVGYTVTAQSADTAETFILEASHLSLSDQRRVNLDDQPMNRRFVQGAAPDWSSVPSPMGLFPPIRQGGLELQSLLNSLQLRLTESDSALSSMLTMARDTLRLLLKSITALRDWLLQVLVLVSALSDGVWVTSFSGQGGAGFLAEELSRRLLRDGMPGQPPFREGRSYVSATLLLTHATGPAGAARVANFTKSWDAFTTPQTTVDLSGVITDLERAVAEMPNSVDTQAVSAEDQGVSLHDLNLGKDVC